jgi:hypothetical protein
MNDTLEKQLQTRISQHLDSTNPAQFDFERWAKAVKIQLLAALNKQRSRGFTDPIDLKPKP